jgi:hypothetical protein
VTGSGPSATSGDVLFCAAVDGRADIKAQATPVHALVLTRLTFAVRLVFYLPEAFDLRFEAFG